MALTLTEKADRLNLGYYGVRSAVTPLTLSLLEAKTATPVLKLSVNGEAGYFAPAETFTTVATDAEQQYCPVFDWNFLGNQQVFDRARLIELPADIAAQISRKGWLSQDYEFDYPEVGYFLPVAEFDEFVRYKFFPDHSDTYRAMAYAPGYTDLAPTGWAAGHDQYGLNVFYPKETPGGFRKKRIIRVTPGLVDYLYACSTGSWAGPGTYLPRDFYADKVWAVQGGDPSRWAFCNREGVWQPVVVGTQFLIPEHQRNYYEIAINAKTSDFLSPFDGLFTSAVLGAVGGAVLSDFFTTVSVETVIEAPVVWGDAVGVGESIAQPVIETAAETSTASTAGGITVDGEVGLEWYSVDPGVDPFATTEMVNAGWSYDGGYAGVDWYNNAGIGEAPGFLQSAAESANSIAKAAKSIFSIFNQGAATYQQVRSNLARPVPNYTREAGSMNLGLLAVGLLAWKLL